MSKKTNFSFKKDKYKSSRSGHSRLLDVYCRKCENIVLLYQKDGSGNLRRLYMDRIFVPDELSNLQNLSIRDVSVLKCKKCGEMLGAPYIYQKEKRKAFRIYQDAITKKVRKLKDKCK